MITDTDRTRIVDLAARYKAKLVLLFGSSATSPKEGKDIDLAVEGIPPQKFFEFYGDILLSLSKPVDLIDLSHDSKFTRLVRKEGLLLYGQDK